MHVVVRERVGLAARERLKRLVVIGGEDELDRQLPTFRSARNRGFVHRPAGEYDRLACEVLKIDDAAAAPHQQLGAGHEHRGRERRNLAALDVIGRGPAFQIDLARGEKLEAVLRGHRPVIGTDFPSQLGHDFLDHDFAQVEGVADRLSAPVDKRERRRVLAVADADDAAVVDFP